MTEKEQILKELYPEDILNNAKELTEGEVKFLKQLDDLLESKYRDSINNHWANATVPEDFFDDMGKLNYFRNPLLFEGREGAKTPSQLFQFFMSYTIARFDVSLVTILGVHQGLGHNAFLFGGSKEQIAKFIIRPEQDGVEIDVIENKIALRIIPNTNIRLDNVVVKEEDRLQNINSFKDIAKILYSTRAGVSYMATGAMAGALRATLDYVTQRKQFGKEISKYQLIQEKLAMMQGNLAHAIAMSAQLARMQENGEYDEVATSTAKMMNALRLRESVSLGRGIHGGNGILAEYDIARFFSDAEAVYTYEGTHEINALVIGRALTGDSAFI
jgi:alkylation response protein AidB-like acyl-CoA dehydrogenase